jgi:NTP pyrophosphatase (non-canonical NTP hydrolase)
MTQESFDKLNNISYEIDEWAKLNFTVHSPKLGILEEIGELTHCILKRAQRIRGFEDFSFFVTHLKDAIGDTMVYLLHDLRMAEEILIWDDNKFNIDDLTTDTTIENLEAIMGELSECAGQHLQGLQYYGQLNYRESILSILDNLCACYGFSLLEIIEETWAKVSKRNWKANSVSGIVNE